MAGSKNWGTSVIGLALGSALLVGVFLGSLAQLPLPLTASLSLSAGVVAILWWREEGLRLASLALLALLLGTVRYQATALPETTAALSLYHGRGVVHVLGEVASEPIVRDFNIDLQLSARQLILGEQTIEVQGGLLVRLPRPASVGYGDVLEIVGTLEDPPQYPGLSYRDHLARQGIASYMAYPRVSGLRAADPTNPLVRLHHLKMNLASTLSRALPEPEGALAQGILLGMRTNLPGDFREALIRSGTMHIVVVSGFNVAIVAGLALRLSRRWLGRRMAAAAALGSIAVFAAFIGPEPPVIRASLMGGLVVLASCLGRPHDASTALALVGAGMVLHNPQVLWDLSFQLSFLATAGLVFLAPTLQSWLTRLPGVIGENLAVTLAAHATTLPIQLLNFGQVSLLAPLVNVVVLPFVGPIMLFSAITALFGSLWQPLAIPLSWLAYLPLTFSVRAIEVGAAITPALIQSGPMPAAFPWLYYAGLSTLLGLRAVSPTSMTCPVPLLSRLPLKPILLTLVLIGAVVMVELIQTPDGRLRVVFLDVGQGDAIMIHTPAGHQVLVDGGPSPSAITRGLGRQLPFWDRSIDLLVLTHPDDDHLVGLLEVLDRYQVDQVLEPGCEEVSPSYQRWLYLLQSRQVRRTLARAGQHIDLGHGVSLQVLYPPGLDGPQSCGNDANSRSVVLRLQSPDLRVLLTGDLEGEGQQELLRFEGDLSSEVLKVPHHGARPALGDGLLDRVSPQVAVISVGQGNRYGHPAPETVALLEAQGVDVYRTDLDGTVEVIVHHTGEYEVKRHRR